MRLVRLTLTTLLALGCACNAERPSAPVTDAAPKAQSTMPAGAAQAAAAVEQAMPAAEPDNTIPAAFQGRWVADVAACGKPADESQLQLMPDRAAFFDGSGPIKSVVIDGDVITIVAELSSEGQTDETTYAFRLSGDGSTLTDISTGPGMVRHRC